MFNEPASSFGDDRLAVRRLKTSLIIEDEYSADSLYSDIRQAVEGVLNVQQEVFAVEEDTQRQRRQLFLMSPDSRLLVTFEGTLRMDAETAYAQLDALFKPFDLLPIFRKSKKATAEDSRQHSIYVVQGRVRPQAGGNVLSLILFGLTVLSVMFVGSLMAIGEISMESPLRAQAMLQDPLMELWRGWPYAVSILLILGAHELGHYFAARYHKTAASLPYFLPFPFGLFGTFGAAIRLREPMRNRKVLLDIGAAGPLAGLVFAVPILFIGLATSTVGEASGGGLVEGNSILYALSKFIVFGEFLPADGRDVFVNQLAWAGWTGLLVTGLNLIPAGQLDGGHILYALLGRFAKILYYPIVGGMIALTFFVAPELAFFVVLIVLLGNTHAIPLNDITPLDSRRRAVALLALLVFVLVFVPSPIQMVTPQALPPFEERIIYLAPAALIMLWQVAHRRMKTR